MNVLVLGATGRVGRELVPQLLDRHAHVSAVTRHPGSANLPAQTTVVQGDPSSPQSFADALSGIDALFLTPRAVGAAIDSLLRLARDCGVRRVVFISALTVEYGGGDPKFSDQFRAAEDIVKASRLDWTILRCADFDANSGIWIPQIRSSNVVRGAYGEAATASLHERDIAAVAAASLTQDGHARATYGLTGPERVSQTEKVRLIGEAIGKNLVWEEIPAEDVRDAMIAAGVPQEVPERILGYLGSISGKAAPCNQTVQQLLGRDALSFAQWAREHSAEFSQAPIAG
jgi:uncharacterized protein YbjT (DUF2867 family)